MDPVITKILEGTPYAGMGGTQERNALIGVIRNLILEDKYTVDYILNYAQSVGYSRQMAEEVFKELTGLSPKLIVNNNAYYDMPAGVPNMCIAWGISKSNKEKAFYLVPFEYGYATMETDGINAPIPTVISATIPEAFDELKKVAKGIQTLDKIITKKLLEAEDVQTDAHTVHQVNLPYAASPLQVLKKNFKDKVLSVSEFEKQASQMLQAGELTVDEAEDLMTWKQDLIDEDESYANEVLENNEKWNEVQATVNFEDVMNEVKWLAEQDEDFIGFEKDAETLFNSNKELFEDVDLPEAAERLYQLLLGFSPEEILGHSKFEKKQEPKKKAYSENLEKALKYIEEQASQDNNAERDLERLAIEEAEKIFNIDGDLLEQALEKRNKKQASKKVKSSIQYKEITQDEWNDKKRHGYTLIDNDIKYILIGDERGTVLQPIKIIKSSKKVTAENITLDDIEAEDNKDQVQEEIEKIDETPAEDIFTESTPEDYLDKALQEDKVDTINDVVSKCIDKFSEKFKDFDKYQVKILSYNTKVLGDDKPVQEEMVEDKELNANAILQVILQITNNAEEANIKKVLAVFSITNGELHWTGTVRGENDQVVAFTEEGLDALFEVNESSEEELEDII